MSDELERIAEECEYAIVHAAGATSWAEVVLPFLRRAAEADRLARRPPGNAPVTPEREAEIREADAATGPGATVSGRPRERRDLLALLDFERARADESEAWCARIANDREGETALMQAGLAKALEVIRSYARLHLDHRVHETLSAVCDLIKDCCAPAPLPPHLRTLVQSQRMKAALVQIAAMIRPDSLTDCWTLLADASRTAGVALKEDVS